MLFYPRASHGREGTTKECVECSPILLFRVVLFRAHIVHIVHIVHWQIVDDQTKKASDVRNADCETAAAVFATVLICAEILRTRLPH